jgi:hypothetical protein
MQGFPDGFTRTTAKRVGAFMMSETGQAILQKARFFLKMKARMIPAR